MVVTTPQGKNVDGDKAVQVDVIVEHVADLRLGGQAREHIAIGRLSRDRLDNLLNPADVSDQCFDLRHLPVEQGSLVVSLLNRTAARLMFQSLVRQVYRR